MEKGNLTDFSRKIAERLSYLYHESLDDFPDQIPMSLDSLESFIFFLQSNGNIKQPNVVLTFTGNIRAVWKKNSGESIAVEFLSNTNDIKYVAFLRNQKPASRMNRMTGMITQDVLFKNFSAFDIGFMFDTDITTE